MALIYEKKKVVLGFKEGKPTVYRIAPSRQQKVTFDKLLDEVSGACGVSRAQAKATIEALIDRMTLFMDYGMRVQLADFGTFKPTINVKCQETEDDLGADNVKRRKIQFFPGKRFKNMLDELSITTLNPGVANGNSGDDGNDDDDGGGGFEDPNA